ncbi:hypothetical protein CEXT_605431 [Caerostris extrusa]|uniref:Uncharacterized protein n=1 Tax=Caerostris extrusa TaxID=172846 RepID=A0AAV4V9R4_CAEEX|nr:hypothetical protein CEXT_605431 [Caerostris extrusa]
MQKSGLRSDPHAYPLNRVICDFFALHYTGLFTPPLVITQIPAVQSLMAKTAAQPKESEKPPMHVHIYHPSNDPSYEGFLLQSCTSFPPEKASCDAN